MDTMLFTMTCIAIVSVGILLWTNTKAGKKWLENLLVKTEVNGLLFLRFV